MCACSHSNAATGYKNVRESSGRFEARICLGGSGRQIAIGRFDTAVEAAVAYARRVGQAEEAGVEATCSQLHARPHEVLQRPAKRARKKGAADETVQRDEFFAIAASSKAARRKQPEASPRH
ncbi:hypothetical protein EMIHUDRAFT_238309 [Emiliania huxleyi CCMP1516]|uniref:AP2/ERF domain-containing protein n=2 Tax=Emiliania huxleyi TaxID=2903 RepID=A0A0D3JMR9_EMIH1|nr:hypothetical protein EMIHUDRAFT_238309 [Emiliania huxleyi CCMP1516]EOD24804.1 hypothetical protein EMIHUDRAFT_238309 [Emiliania huxleyi CCMP1516]|eukprot:XP_005777233.1 hypothetical protein EMIHUDRAFT_238309 [Emiliania huxleyi CCMP1516]